MKSPGAVLVFLSAVFPGLYCEDRPRTDVKQPVVKCEAGEFFGRYEVSRRGRRFESYRGMRYAEPPVGELRFQPPVAIAQYLDPVNASVDGPACPHRTRPGSYVSEDCLRINVYSPLREDRSSPLPVVVYIHAGGLYSMTARSDLAGPHVLLDRDLVLVTFNYRLGSLGFLSTGDALAPGNNGFKDQVVALRWVQRNIAAFGGDPTSVTIAGCSAGSLSVLLHMVSPMSKGLFHRAISMSGSPISKAPLTTDLYQLAVKQAQLLDCPTNNSKIIIDCLKTKSWRDLGTSVLGFYEFAFDPVRIWNPVVEKDFGQERFLDMQPTDSIRENKIHAVPYIVSQTQGEFFWMAFTVLKNKTLTNRMNSEWESIAPISFLLPRENKTYAKYAARRLRTQYLKDKDLSNEEESVQNLGLLYADAIVSFPVHRMFNLMVRHSPQPVWYYEFSFVGNHSHYEDPVTKKAIAAAHHDDLIYLFSLSYRFPALGTDGEDAAMADRLTAIWYNFAKYGDPNPRGDSRELSGLRWPQATPGRRTYLRIDNQLSLHENLKEDRMNIWEKLYPLEY
ncbi:juvenile hormone esterase-like [Danaus plexippus]|uniref:juvenile hormone esterase-like n=1 Tax=Danaus plexippus TaxID=13037 RepID=UPI002AB2F1AD|nr:juvenile hormone esterase-like [Danaus plexippus]